MFVCFRRDSPQWARAFSFKMFLDHTQRRTKFGTNTLDEWLARRRDLYLTAHNTHKRQISMPPMRFESTISAGERPETYALECASTGTGILILLYYVIYGELWLQLVEIFCLSELGYHVYLKGWMHKYGTIAKVWIGPLLLVGLADAKYVEVSEVTLALWTKQKRKSCIKVRCNPSVALRLKCNCCPVRNSYNR